MKNLEVGQDYINVHDNNFIVIDRTGDITNRGFNGNNYVHDLFCSQSNEWREATEEEVIGAFKRYLVYRYGKDWETIKIKEKHPDSILEINDSSWNVGISKFTNGWGVRNKNGLLYCNGIWVERLEEELKIHIKDAIKKNTVIHCVTIEEAERILNIAHESGYKWTSGEGYKNNTEWEDYEEKTCYNIFDGHYGYVKFYESNYEIIPSTQIADLEPPKLSDWVIAPEDVKEIKASEKADNRYALKRDVLTILSVESKLNPDKKLSEYLEQFKLILEVL